MIECYSILFFFPQFKYIYLFMKFFRYLLFMGEKTWPLYLAIILPLIFLLCSAFNFPELLLLGSILTKASSSIVSLELIFQAPYFFSASLIWILRNHLHTKAVQKFSCCPTLSLCQWKKSNISGLTLKHPWLYRTILLLFVWISELYMVYIMNSGVLKFVFLLIIEYDAVIIDKVEDVDSPLFAY